MGASEGETVETKGTGLGEHLFVGVKNRETCRR